MSSVTLHLHIAALLVSQPQFLSTAARTPQKHRPLITKRSLSESSLECDK